MRRVRVVFGKGEEVRYISHLDLMRTWERILRRAGIKLVHSQGFNPRPKLVFAAPLPVGVTSDAEIVDVDIEDDSVPAEFRARVHASLPPGITLASVSEVPLETPPLMASVLSSDYLVDLAASDDVAPALADFLARDHVPYERLRKGTVKEADMRPAVLDLRQESAPLPRIGMCLRLDIEGLTVRPEEVVRALDANWRILRVHRTALQLKDGRYSAPGPPEAEDSAQTPNPVSQTQNPKFDSRNYTHAA